MHARAYFAAICLSATLAISGRSESVRTAAWAGKLYPADAKTLSTAVDGYLAHAPTEKLPSPMRAGVFPLGPYGQIGALAGRLANRIPKDTRTILMLTTWHPTTDHLPQDRRDMTGKVSIPAKTAYRTPLGDVSIAPAARTLREEHGCFVTVSAAHYWEPGVEVFLPFLQRRFHDSVTILPLVLDRHADPRVVAEGINPLLSDPNTVLIAAVSASKVHVEAIDQALCQGDSAPISSLNLADATLVEVLLALAEDQAWKALPITLETGGDDDTKATPRAWTSGGVVFVKDENRVDLIRKAAEADWEDPATKAAFEDAARAAARPAFQGDLLSVPEQELLLWLARETLAAKLADKKLPPLPLYSDTFTKKMGSFVTLTKNGALRGCIGTLAGNLPLVAGIQKNTLAAAFKDKRFPPLTAEELPDIRIEISILTPPRTIAYKDADDLLRQLVPGKHGVVLTYKRQKRSTYLPQVWHQMSDKEKFLTRLCRKGGMPPDAWKDPKTMSVALYEAFVFKESKP